MTSIFSPLSFVAVFGSGIRDKHPGSATLASTFRFLENMKYEGCHKSENWENTVILLLSGKLLLNL
jgi:hypothetical protein